MINNTVSFLYIIASNTNGPVKLGYSDNPERRLKQLQTGNPENLKIFHCEEIEVDNIRKAEKSLHTTLGYKRLKGEWFSLNVSDAISEAIYARIMED